MNFYLIDGNSYVYRAFYAIRGLTNSRGFPTNAIYGFTNMLLKIVRDRKPDGIAVFFDTPEQTERHRLYADYKANRSEMPHELVQQLPYIRTIIAGFNIKIFELPGFEADDLIGTVATKISSKGDMASIVTADKDMLQLVSDNIHIYDPMKDIVIGRDYVMEKFGVGPERVTEVMALTGDASDNIPGIKGVGEKTARELITSFSSLEELLDHPERIKRERLRKMVAENRDVVLLSKRLATIDTSVPVDFDISDFFPKGTDWLSLLPLFREFEFTSLLKLIPEGDKVEREYETVFSEDRLTEVVSLIKTWVAFDLESTGMDPHRDNIVGISLCVEAMKAYYIPVAHSCPISGGKRQLDIKKVLDILGPLFMDREIVKIGHNLKYDLVLLSREGIIPSGLLIDTMIFAYLLNPNKSSHSLGEVSFEYLNKRKQSYIEVLRKRTSFAEVPVEEAAPYACEDAALALELKGVLEQKMAEQGLQDVYFKIEMPLITVLTQMEKAGIRIDSELLNGLSRETAKEIDSIQQRIFFMAGREFNINSTKQLSSILFHCLGLSPRKKTKTGFSTSVEVLEELAESHELPREVLHYRSLTKLKTTYLDVLPALVNPLTGRLHTSFNQTITATGRLSSSDPNLQNIPIKGDMGTRIRKAFIAEEGCLLLSADYSQVELRILAHLSGDKVLTSAFTEDIDVHTRTASELHGVPLDEVTADMRRTAKTVNFGVIYGISPFGLSGTLNIDFEKAKKYITHYFDRHPGVRTYIEQLLSDAELNGYVTTMFGRKRPVPELKSRNKTTRQFGERLAVNSPIQGTAADIIKIAMIRIHERFRLESIRAKMILQIHDELLFELPGDEADLVKKIVREEMEGAAKLSVPLRVDIGLGKNWDEAH